MNTNSWKANELMIARTCKDQEQDVINLWNPELCQLFWALAVKPKRPVNSIHGLQVAPKRLVRMIAGDKEQLSPPYKALSFVLHLALL
jgi:hypothetical protein